MAVTKDLRALIFIADGTEEMEFTITYDTLVRAGIKCTSAFVQPESEPPQSNVSAATCSRGVRIVPDTTLEQLNVLSESVGAHTPVAALQPLDGSQGTSYDVYVVPGGAKGAETISQNTKVQTLLKTAYEEGKIVGMICAGSLAALTSKLPRQEVTSHPSVKGQLENDFDYLEDPVVVSKNLVTSRGPGTTFPFALKIVEILLGKEKRAEVQGPMVFPAGAI